MDSFLDKLFAWFRGPKEEEDAPMHEERAPHEAAEERPAESEERFHDFRHEERASYEAPEEQEAWREERFHDFEHERHAPYGAPEEAEAEKEEPDPATFATAAGLKMKKEQEA